MQNRRIELPTEWVDEIPTGPSPFKAGVVSIALILLGGLGVAAGFLMPWLLVYVGGRNADVAILLENNHIGPSLRICFVSFLGVAALCVAAGAISLTRIRASYYLLLATLIAVYVVTVAYVSLTWRGVFSILDADIELDGSPLDKATTLQLWWKVSWPALLVLAYAVWLNVMLRSRSVHAVFFKASGSPMSGDRTLEDLRTHGRDPRHRKSLYASVLTHLMILVIIPYLLSIGGCVEAYKVPKGSGNPVVAMVKVVQPKKKKKKTLTLRPNSAIIFDQPDLDNTEVDQVMEKQTQLTYEASANAKAGKMGKGGGTDGGWPEGMEDYKVRFIRLDHGGAGWDDGMDQTDADINFLRNFAQATGFKKIARKGESHSIALLSKYPDDGFPPFVYLTGNGNMGRVSSADAKILREYCLKGGMLIADAGSESFHRSFTHFIRQVFPDKPLLDIADDDMLYQLPYGFPDGAPAFWHHGGRRALGIKHEGRWIAFYHPGDMNDAWKSPGYTDVTPEMRDAAMNLGINLVYYSFNQWNDAIAKQRK
ncbi:lytTR family transcriptional regulator [Haloferula helveola]|uniref:LytTR family transcriptional regulator n=1 Tax=Haloferula helveola TaxID=490095 RepID=A0ABN6GYA7_9BACT|nr:lytTR family transcriptional regulator [Haloferula helveola]